MPLPRAYTNYVGRKLFRFLLTVQGIGAFALITLGVMLTKFRTARQLIWPLVFQETARAGWRLARRATRCSPAPTATSGKNSEERDGERPKCGRESS